MKYGKKIMAVFCAAACAAASFALAACRGEHGGANSLTGGNEHDETKIDKRVTEEEWIAAFSAMESVKSVKSTRVYKSDMYDKQNVWEYTTTMNVTYYSDFEVGKSWAEGVSTQKSARSPEMKVNTTGAVIRDGYDLYMTTCMNNQYQVMCLNCESQMENQDNFVQYVINTDYLSVMSFPNENNEEILYCKDMYSRFIYDEQTGYYVYTSENYVKDPYPGSYQHTAGQEISIQIKDGYVWKYILKTGNGGDVLQLSTLEVEFSDYNKTKVTIPERHLQEINNYKTQNN